MAAVAFNISASCIIRGCDNNSTVWLADIAFVLNRLNTEAPAVSVRVIVSAFPESSETSIDFIIVVVAAGPVYIVVAVLVVRSAFMFVYILAT